MFRYSKTTQNAIAAISRLAEVYDPKGKTFLSSMDIAKVRRLPKPNVAKLLTTLSQSGLVTSSHGPGGGYALAKSPKRIALYDIAALFERIEDNINCPFGPHWCGTGDPCPLHDDLTRLDEQWTRFLKKTTLDVFTRTQQAKAPRSTRRK